ncbi:MAG: hypothetical protein Q9170_003655 [Blastenia crenularia]
MAFENGSSESSDDDTISLTSTVASEQQSEYTLEAVLAEIVDVDGITWYLVKWENYPDLRCTWEVEEHFQHEQTLIDWTEQKMQISRGLVEPFDVTDWEKRTDEFKAATIKRKALRRKKKNALSLAAADTETSSNPSDDEERHDSDTNHQPPSPTWTAKEESTLLEGISRFKSSDWKQLLRMYGPNGILNENLKGKTEIDLRNKACALKKDFEVSGKQFPISLSFDEINHKDFKPRKEDKTTRKRQIQRKEASRRPEFTGTALSRKPHTASRKPSDSLDRPEKPRIKILPPVPTHDVSEAQGRLTTPKNSASLKLKENANPNADPSPQGVRRPSLPLAAAGKRSTQLGTMGRGPARQGLPAANIPMRQPVNVLKNWSSGPEKIRRSRYEMRTPQEAEAKPSGTFKKFSTQRKFVLAGRYEHTPDVNSLTFVDVKDGKVLPKGPASVVPKPNKKTPFQLLQEQLGDDQAARLDPPDSAVMPGLQRAATIATSTSKSTLPEADMQGTGEPNIKEPAESNDTLPRPKRRASISSGTPTQEMAIPASTFPAPIATMSSRPDATKDVSSPRYSGTPRSDVNSAHERGGFTQQDEVESKQTHKNHSEQASSLEPPNWESQISLHQLSHNRSHPKYDQTSTSTNSDASKAALLRLMASNPQPRADGYALFPLDSLPATYSVDSRRQPTDVIAEILTGNEGDSTGPVTFRGLADHALKRQFLTIRVPPRQVVSGVLAEHASGSLFFAENFTLLIYPANCVGWEFLDEGFPHIASIIPPETRLRFVMFTPWPQIQPGLNESYSLVVKADHQLALQDAPINAIFRSRFRMDFQRLVAQSMDKDGSKTKLTKSFFLIFPPSAQDEFDIAVDWIQANLSATIFRYDDQGAWTHFVETVEKGVIICHASFIDYWAIPYLAHELRKSINMFNFSLEPMSSLGPDPHLIRLFPNGTAIILTDSLFLYRPIEAARILSWYRLSVIPNKPPGAWMVCTRPAIREWLLKIQEGLRVPYGRDFVKCYGEIMRLLPSKVTQEWDREIPRSQAPIACMSSGMSSFDERLGTGVSSLAEMDNRAVIQNDNTLSFWFAGWAMTKQERYRRFYIVTGRDDGKEQQVKLKERMKKYSHVEILSFEKFAKWQNVWDESRLKKAEAAERDKAAFAQQLERKRRESAVAAANGDVEMKDGQQTEEESLVLPMDMSPS